MLRIILIIVAIVIFSSGLAGIMYYFRKFKALASEMSDLVKAILGALADGKITEEEKELIIKEAMDLSPIAKNIKDQFVADAKSLGGKVSSKVQIFAQDNSEKQS